MESKIKSESIHEMYMRRAIEIAKTAEGYTSPNPMVGCVVVKDGKIISEACHERYGEFHAERNALTRCKEDINGAELYVTLEPCCHFGKTPPCTDIIIEKGIHKVYVGSLDSNPLVAGQGVEKLRQHGIEVETGILEQECLKMNEIFFHYITHKTPFVALKYAMTLDGKIAAVTGDSKWVTNEVSRAHVQKLRRKYSGIMVGIQTVLEDNPMLNCRICEGADPVRIILDSNLRIPLDCDIVKTAKDIRTIVAYSGFGNKDSQNKIEAPSRIDIEQNTKQSAVQNMEQKKQLLLENGIELIKTTGSERVNLVELMKKLGEMKIDSVLIEGGASVNASALEAGIVSKVYAYIAPKIIMGAQAKSPIGGAGIPLMKDAVSLKDITITNMDGGDILMEGYVK